MTVDINGISREEGVRILNQFYEKVVPFDIAEDQKIVNPERVAATLIIPESCFPFSGYCIDGIKNCDNGYHYEVRFSSILDHIFLRAYIENDCMTDKRVFNLIFCPNEPNPKVKELVRLMAFSRQELARILVIGQYRYDSLVEISKLGRRRGALAIIIN